MDFFFHGTILWVLTNDELWFMFFSMVFSQQNPKKNDGSGDRTGLLMVQLNNHMLNHHVCDLKRSLPEVFK